MSRQYTPEPDDYAEDDQLLAELAAEAAAEAARDAEAMDAAWGALGPWPTDEEVAEYERTLNQRRTA